MRETSPAAAGAVLLFAAALLMPLPGRADEPRADPRWPTAEEPAYPASPYHGARDGDGRIIPCRCRYQGREFRLGDLVCMSTPSGRVLTRCDLMQNNTSWVPTASPCTTSRAPQGLAQIAGTR